MSKTIDLLNEVRGLFKIFGIRQPRTAKQGSFDGVVTAKRSVTRISDNGPNQQRKRA
ncbi:hypothetical protein [Roseovarius sp.]|uniref:hypothetical protein n=1 Tax=Roseovarius sp. TaxID=1486281 RepID=UPI003D101B06